VNPRDVRPEKVRKMSQYLFRKGIEGITEEDVRQRMLAEVSKNTGRKPRKADTTEADLLYGMRLCADSSFYVHACVHVL
jgi:hypothetical protein